LQDRKGINRLQLLPLTPREIILQIAQQPTISRLYFF
jgi:hypothetical protein